MDTNQDRAAGDVEHSVRLSARAERALRALPREQQLLLARRIDSIARLGVPRDAIDGDAGVRIVDAGSNVLMCVEHEGAIVVAAIEPVEERAQETVRRAAKAPLLAATSGRLGRALADLVMDIRFALRTFRRQPTFVAVTVLTLALGIGGNTAVFGVFSNVFLGELPLRDADRLLRLRNYSVATNGETRTYNMSPRDFLQIRERADSLEDVVGMQVHSFTVSGDAEPERISGVFVSEDMTGILGVVPVLGAGFTAEQEALGADSGVVIIGHAFWQRRYGGGADALGRTLLLDGRPYVVIGVMPTGFEFPYDAELWTPIRFAADDGRSHDLNVMAHMEPDVDIGTVHQELDALAATLAEEFPDTNRDIGMQIRYARDEFIDGDDDTVMALLGAVGFLLLITCVNVTNVLIARFMSRQHEVGIRAALGAGRFRQLRQFLAETVLIFAAGGAGGLLLTMWLRNYLVVLIPEVLRDQLNLGEVRMSAGIVGFTLVVTLVAALLCGGLAAMRAMSTNLQQVLKDGGRSTSSTTRRLMQRGLVVAEVSLALVLLVGAGLMIDHFRTLQGQELGFDADDLLTLRINLEGTAYDTAERRSVLLGAMEQAVAAVPGVTGVGMTTVNPLCCGDWGAIVEIEGREAATDGSRILVSHRYVSADLHAAMGIALNRGRLFEQQDDARSEPAVIIDQRMADHYWPGDDPLGQRVKLGSRPDSRWLTIVGVVGTIRDVSDYDDGWYLPFHQDAAARGTDELHLMMRLQGNAEQIVPAAQQAIWDVAPDLAIYDVRMMKDVGDDLVADDRLAAMVAAIFALMGTALAGFGVYGLMAFYVGRQRLEIGTRLALGAKPVDVLRMVLRQALVMTAIGLGLGIAASIALSRVMAYFMSGLDSSSIPMVAGVAILLGTATMAATWIPARRAARVDPMQVLRSGD